MPNWYICHSFSISGPIDFWFWLMTRMDPGFNQYQYGNNRPKGTEIMEMLSKIKPLTTVRALSQLPVVAHQWLTLLTVIMRFLSTGKAGCWWRSPYSHFIWHDSLWEVIQLLDTRSDLKRTVVPRLGELHVIKYRRRSLWSVPITSVLFVSTCIHM